MTRRVKDPTVRLCPRCRSAEMQLSSWLDAWLLPEVYICKKCGYRGPLVLELTREENPAS